MQRLRVRRGVHGHRLDTEFPARPDDAQGDLSTVRDEDLAEHQKRQGSGTTEDIDPTPILMMGAGGT